MPTETEPETPQPRRTRSALLSRLFFAVGLSVYIAVVWYFGWREVRDELLGVDIVPLIAAGALVFVGAGARLVKWRVALGPDAHAVGLYFISRATAVWSPGRVGEFLPLLWKRHRSARVGGWILLDRVLEIVVTLGFGVVGLAFIDLVAPRVTLVIAVASVAGSALMVYILTRDRWLHATADRFSARPRVQAVVRMLAATAEEIRALGPTLAATVGLTVLGKGVDFVAVALIFQAMGYRIGFMLASASKCALAIVSFIPITPVATGVPHAVQGWIMNEVAQVPPEATVASIAFEVVLMLTAYWTLAGFAAREIKSAAL